MKGESRRLVAIMFTDIVGYASLVQKNEAVALELLEENRQLLRPLFTQYGGRTVKTTGDGFLVEFASVLEAVRCAIEIQGFLEERNASAPEERRIRIRIGIHLGDVESQEGDLLGDGVNIASRIESLAEPGGVCISEQVYHQVRNKIDEPIVGIGKQELKNIREPMELYKIVLSSSSVGAASAPEETKSIRVLIADDHAVVREGLKALISTEARLEVAGEASDGEEAVFKARVLKPDVILMDLVMPRKDGIQAIGEITQEMPEARILVLTSFAEDKQIISAVKAGALGYLLKDSSPQDLIQAIRAVYQGDSSLHPTVAHKLIHKLHRPSEDVSRESLTEREVKVLRLIAQGLSNHEIAKKLFISDPTVRTHVSNILRKLHLVNRTQAALYALREGLASLDE